MGERDSQKADVPVTRKEYEELQNRIQKLEAEHNDKGVSRREVIGGAGALGIGAILGGGSSEAIGSAQAAGSSAGDVGQPDDPVDVWANQVEADQLTVGDDTVTGLNEVPTGKVGFGTEFVTNNIVGSGWNDPDIYHKDHFDDGEYRVTVYDGSVHHLYRTPDFESFSEISSNLGYNVDTLQDHVVVDGEFYVYATAGGDARTEVLTGSSLTNLTNQGTVMSEPDCGAFYEEGAGTIHVYPEDSDTASGVSSEKLSHWTSPETDPTNATQQADALDLTGKPYKTGDPEIVSIGDWYYLFFDRVESHPAYRIGLAASRDLDTFEVISDAINPDAKGGDICISRYQDQYVGMTEYTGSGESGVGKWRVWPHRLATDEITSGPAGPSFRDNSEGETRAEFTQTSNGSTFLDYQEDPGAGTNAQSGFRVVDKNGNAVGRLSVWRNGGTPKTVLEPLNNNGLNIGVPGTGQPELQVEEDTTRIPDGVNLEMGASGARIFLDAGEIKVEDEAGNISTIS